jgi:hypothetical protein
VYNLTIAKTHAYFVGSERLLVHNVHCDQKRRVEAHQSLTRSHEHERQRREERRHFNDANGDSATTNCAFCTAGGLSDYDLLSTFLYEHNLDGRFSINERENTELLQRLRLTLLPRTPSAESGELFDRAA